MADQSSEAPAQPGAPPSISLDVRQWFVRWAAAPPAPSATDNAASSTAAVTAVPTTTTTTAAAATTTATTATGTTTTAAGTFGKAGAIKVDVTKSAIPTSTPKPEALPAADAKAAPAAATTTAAATATTGSATPAPTLKNGTTPSRPRRVVTFVSTFPGRRKWEVPVARAMLRRVLLMSTFRECCEAVSFTFEPVGAVGTDTETVECKIVVAMNMGVVEAQNVLPFFAHTRSTAGAAAAPPHAPAHPGDFDEFELAAFVRAFLGIVPTWACPSLRAATTTDNTSNSADNADTTTAAADVAAAGTGGGGVMAVAGAAGTEGGTEATAPPATAGAGHKRTLHFKTTAGLGAVLPSVVFSNLHKASTGSMARDRVGSAVFASVQVIPEDEGLLDSIGSGGDGGGGGGDPAARYEQWKSDTKGAVLAAVDRLLHRSGLTYEKTPDRAPMMRELTRRLATVNDGRGPTKMSHLTQYVSHLRQMFRQFLAVQHDEKEVAPNAFSPVTNKERPIPHSLTHFDVSAVTWWRDPSKPAGVLDVALLVDVPGVVQQPGGGCPPPLPSAELELEHLGVDGGEGADAPPAPGDSLLCRAEPAADAASGDAEAPDAAAPPREDEEQALKRGDAAHQQRVAARADASTQVWAVHSVVGESFVRKVDKLEWSQQRVHSCRRVFADPTCFQRQDAEADLDLGFFNDAVVQPHFLPREEVELTNVQLTFLVLLRRSSSVVSNPYLDAISDPHSVGVLCDLLYHSHPKIRFESAWVLTNIASGTTEQIEKLNNPNTFARVLTPLLDSNVDVVEQIVWLVGNIVGDGPQFRDLFLTVGAHTLLMDIFDANHSSAQLCRQLAWVFSNFCRGKPLPASGHIQPLCSLLPILCASTDVETRIDTYWMASYLTADSEAQSILGLLNPSPYAGLRRREGGPNSTVLGFRGNPARPYFSVADQTYSRMQKYFFHGSCKGVFRTFLTCQERCRRLGRKTLEGSMVQNVFNMCPQIVVSCLDHFRQVLQENASPIQPGAAAEPPHLVTTTGAHVPVANLKLLTPIVRAVGNIAACTDGAIVQVLVDKGFIPLLLDCLAHPSVYEKRTLVKEVFWIMSNFAAGTPLQIQLTMECGIVQLALKVLITAIEKRRGEVLLRTVPLFGAGGLPFDPAEAVRKEAMYVLANVTEREECLERIIHHHPDWVHALVFFLVHGQQEQGANQPLYSAVLRPVFADIGRHPDGPQALREALAKVFHAPGQTSVADALSLAGETANIAMGPVGAEFLKAIKQE